MEVKKNKNASDGINEFTAYVPRYTCCLGTVYMLLHNVKLEYQCKQY